MKARDAAEFRVLAETRYAGLRRTAWALSGNWHDADDLVQTALMKLYARWPLRDPEAVDAWLRRTLVTSHVDETRRAWRRRERPTDKLPERAGPDVAAGGLADDDLVLGLRRLPPRTRACLVLRYLEDYSQEQTADVLGLTVGNVKSHTSRGLAALRTRAESRPEMSDTRPGGHRK